MEEEKQVEQDIEETINPKKIVEHLKESAKLINECKNKSSDLSTHPAYTEMIIKIEQAIKKLGGDPTQIAKEIEKQDEKAKKELDDKVKSIHELITKHITLLKENISNEMNFIQNKKLIELVKSESAIKSHEQEKIQDTEGHIKESIKECKDLISKRKVLEICNEIKKNNYYGLSDSGFVKFIEDLLNIESSIDYKKILDNISKLEKDSNKNLFDKKLLLEFISDIKKIEKRINQHYSLKQTLLIKLQEIIIQLNKKG